MRSGFGEDQLVFRRQRGSDAGAEVGSYDREPAQCVEQHWREIDVLLPPEAGAVDEHQCAHPVRVASRHRHRPGPAQRITHDGHGVVGGSEAQGVKDSGGRVGQVHQAGTAREGVVEAESRMVHRDHEVVVRQQILGRHPVLETAADAVQEQYRRRVGVSGQPDPNPSETHCQQCGVTRGSRFCRASRRNDVVGHAVCSVKAAARAMYGRNSRFRFARIVWKRSVMAF